LVAPYEAVNIFQYGVQFFDSVKDVARLTSTCRQYRIWSKTIPNFWQNIAAYCGIPTVANFDGTARLNTKYDLFVLSRFMISTKVIERLFGTVVGKLGPISDYWFDKFDKPTPDPYEEGSLFADNYKLMADPAYIRRRVDRETPLDMDDKGNLEEVDPEAVEERTLIIPFSLRNICILAKYPLSGRDYLPVFTKMSMCAKKDEALTSIPQRLGTYVIRKAFLKYTANFYLFQHQEQYVRAPNVGLEVASPRIRALCNAIDILTTGECPDSGMYVAGSGEFVMAGTIYHFITGNFIRGQGVDIYYGHARKILNAVVPGAVANAPEPLQLARLVIDKAKEACAIL